MKKMSVLIMIMTLVGVSVQAEVVATWSFDDQGVQANADLSATVSGKVTASDIWRNTGYAYKAQNAPGWTNEMLVQIIDEVKYTYIESDPNHPASGALAGGSLTNKDNISLVGDWDDGSATGGDITVNGTANPLAPKGSTDSGTGAIYLWSQSWRQDGDTNKTALEEALDNHRGVRFSLTGVESCLLNGVSSYLAREDTNKGYTWEQWYLLADVNGDGLDIGDVAASGETQGTDLDTWHLMTGDMKIFLGNGQTIDFVLLGTNSGNNGPAHPVALDDISISCDSRVAGNPEPASGSIDLDPTVLNEGATLKWDMPTDAEVSGGFLTLDTDPNFIDVSTGIKNVYIAGNGAGKSFDSPFEFQLGQTIYWQIETQINNSPAGDPNNLMGGMWTFKTAAAVPKVDVFENVMSAKVLMPAVLSATVSDYDMNVSEVSFSSSDAEVRFENGNGDLYHPTIEVVSEKASGDHVFEVVMTVTDADGHEVSETAEVTIYEDACTAAQAAEDWGGFNHLDRSVIRDCLVDIQDLVALASQWLDNRTMTAQYSY